MRVFNARNWAHKPVAHTYFRVGSHSFACWFVIGPFVVAREVQ